MIAALYTRDEGSVYDCFDDVETWGKRLDARRYAGHEPVIAHPPCNCWGRYGGHYGNVPGDDGGCGAAAIAAVRRCGGVLEHPAGSGLFLRHLLARPGCGRDLWGGITYRIDQGMYGHRAKKPTWLYCVGIELVNPRVSVGPRQWVPVESMGRPERERTPCELANLLVGLARSVSARRERGVA